MALLITLMSRTAKTAVGQHREKAKGPFTKWNIDTENEGQFCYDAGKQHLSICALDYGGYLLQQHNLKLRVTCTNPLELLGKWKLASSIDPILHNNWRTADSFYQ